ncbi:MAG: cupin domain-containing protein [Candidatus Latescibacterota bacterium]|nr:MAG: cupin domain-containing protein [Candidatus Latescibacterota bacterium]
MSDKKNTNDAPQVTRLADMVEYQTGSIVSRTLVKQSQGSVTLFAFDKDNALSEHTAPFDALLYIVDGDMEVTIDGEAYFLTAGETILMPANHPHAVRAMSRAKMLLTMIRS